MGSRRRQSGLALILVMVLVAASTILGLAALARSSLKLTCSDNLRQAERARYLAESGLQHGLHILDTWPALPSGAQGPCTLDSTPDAYSFTIQALSDSDRYLVSSTAQVGAIQQSSQAKVEAKSRYYSLMRSLAPEHYWRLGESSGDRAYDVADGWTGYHRGVQLQSEGAIIRDGDSSVYFDGQDDYVDLRDVDLEGNAVTITAWVWPQDYGNLTNHDGRIVSKSESVLKDEHYWMLSTCRVGSQTRLRFRLRTNGSVHELLAWTGDVQEQQWTFAVAVYDGSQMRLYQNGILVGSCAKSGWINENEHIESWIGGNASHRRDHPWWGRIDEVAFFDYALNEAQIQALYNARYPKLTLLSWSE